MSVRGSARWASMTQAGGPLRARISLPRLRGALAERQIAGYQFAAAAGIHRVIFSDVMTGRRRFTEGMAARMWAALPQFAITPADVAPRAVAADTVADQVASKVGA